MATLRLPIHSYRHRSSPASPCRLMNCYAEALPEGAKSPFVLTRAPGITLNSDFGNGPIRGMHAARGYLYAVSGSGLYQARSTGVGPLVSSTGAPISGSGNVSMAHNDTHLVVVSEPNAYYVEFDLEGGAFFTPIVDPDFTARGAKYVKFLDNFMVFMEPNSGRLFWSDVGSAISFDSLNFVTAEALPDDLVGMEVDHRQLLAFGTDSLEILGFTENGLERTINGVVEIGCFNGDTVARLDNTVFWLANDYTIRRLNGLTPERVSTHALEQFLVTADVTTGRAYSYSQDGHFFYVLCFASGCWVYDATTREWAERSSYPHDYFRWQHHAVWDGRQYVGDAYGTNFGYFDPENYTENFLTQRMEWTYNPVYSENKRAIHHRFEIVMETGVGLTVGQGSDPEIMLAYSDDGGRTWTNLPNKKIGKIGEFKHRIWWTGLGSATERVYRAAISDPVKAVISDTTLEATGGRI
jgi:hypothetical protein